ncbi:hypothetical protein [uncultured Bacteroides sp.]|uniref:hypothetical protein n=1 Tax=uncultured Bacteroides sp. TaxID=162156 RepID=UPI0025F60CA0|nr:hypothetical protein [uncultured Bacteroides sp.]
MKQPIFETISVVGLLLITSFGHAQLTPPFNVRNQRTVQLYQLTPQQANDYQRVLDGILQKWKVVKDSKCSPAERKEAEQKLQNELCANVRKIFPDTQYVLWDRNHRGNLTVRFYKEDLGMDNDQFAKFRILTQTYSTQKTQISGMNLLEAERSERRAKAFQEFSNGLYNIVSKELADYLIYENRILNAAKILSKKYTILSENKAVRYAMLKFRHEEELEKLEMQKLPQKLFKKAKNELLDNYEKSLLSFLTNEEYVACNKSRDQLTDKKFAQEYKMSNAQLAKYKELRKRLAMKELTIKQNKKDKADKPVKLQAARKEFEKDMEKLLGAEQYKRWKKNEVLKEKKKQK